MCKPSCLAEELEDKGRTPLAARPLDLGLEFTMLHLPYAIFGHGLSYHHNRQSNALIQAHCAIYDSKPKYVGDYYTLPIYYSTDSEFQLYRYYV